MKKSSYPPKMQNKHAPKLDTKISLENWDCLNIS